MPVQLHTVVQLESEQALNVSMFAVRYARPPPRHQAAHLEDSARSQSVRVTTANHDGKLNGSCRLHDSVQSLAASSGRFLAASDSRQPCSIPGERLPVQYLQQSKYGAESYTPARRYSAHNGGRATPSPILHHCKLLE